MERRERRKRRIAERGGKSARERSEESETRSVARISTPPGGGDFARSNKSAHSPTNTKTHCSDAARRRGSVGG